jgi:hypothetical protein
MALPHSKFRRLQAWFAVRNQDAAMIVKSAINSSLGRMADGLSEARTGSAGVSCRGWGFD